MNDQARRDGRSPGRRPRRVSAARLTRSIVLGAVAVVFAIAWVARELGLDRDELLGFLYTSLLFVLGLAMLGLLGGALVWLIRRTGRRRT